MKSSFGNATDKKVPESKKYSHVESSIDTGATSKRQVPVSSAVCARRRDEIFKRIKPATLVGMLKENAVNESVFAMGDGADRGGSASSVVASKAAPAASVTAASIASVHSVAGSVLSVVESDATVDQSRDLVLLDLREPSDFDQCRLPLAINYPATKINRDQFSPELHRCKRDTSKILVVYHTDDQSTAGVATLLVQKGWETVHALSGGFDEMRNNYPEELDGEVPDRPDTGATTRSSRTATSRR